MFHQFFCYNQNQRLLRHLAYRGLVQLADERKLVFRYELSNGRHDIDVMALAKGLGQYCELLNYFSGSIRDDAALNIRVEALSPGSFEVNLRLFEWGQGVIGTLVANDFVGFIGNVLDMFRQFIELKRLLGSEKADKIMVGDNGYTLIVKGNNNTVVAGPVWEAYKGSEAANEFLRGGSSALVADNSIEGVSIQDVTSGTARDIVNMNKTQLAGLTSHNAYLQEETQEVTISGAELLLMGSNFEFKGKWRFGFGKRTIAANIADDDFILKVKSGALGFRSKDVFTADMKVIQKALPGSEYWEDKEFVITKVKAINNLRDLEAEKD
ncbi:MAG: hypothetical protein K6E42_08850 [Synergistes sp.]|nr:hypothetical protein [Synergistes sp.]